MYEHKSQPLLSPRLFLKRVSIHFFVGICIIAIFLLLGVVGYHYSAGIPWIDSFHNASMILSGMGPVVEIKSVGGKWFSSIYALVSGVVFITNIGIILAPAIHRLLHRVHLEK